MQHQRMSRGHARKTSLATFDTNPAGCPKSGSADAMAYYAARRSKRRGSLGKLKKSHSLKLIEGYAQHLRRWYKNRQTVEQQKWELYTASLQKEKKKALKLSHNQLWAQVTTPEGKALFKMTSTLDQRWKKTRCRYSWKPCPGPLPAMLWRRILDRLSPGDILQVRAVCQSFKDMVEPKFIDIKHYVREGPYFIGLPVLPDGTLGTESKISCEKNKPVRINLHHIRRENNVSERKIDHRLLAFWKYKDELLTGQKGIHSAQAFYEGKEIQLLIRDQDRKIMAIGVGNTYLHPDSLWKRYKLLLHNTV